MLRWLCGAILKAKDDHIAHLEAENAWLRSQLVHERQRAEISVDQRLTERGLGPVTLPPRPTEPERLSDEVQRLMHQPEFFAPSIEEAS